MQSSPAKFSPGLPTFPESLVSLSATRLWRPLPALPSASRMGKTHLSVAGADEGDVALAVAVGGRADVGLGEDERHSRRVVGDFDGVAGLVDTWSVSGATASSSREPEGSLAEMQPAPKASHVVETIVVRLMAFGLRTVETAVGGESVRNRRGKPDDEFSFPCRRPTLAAGSAPVRWGTSGRRPVLVAPLALNLTPTSAPLTPQGVRRTSLRFRFFALLLASATWASSCGADHDEDCLETYRRILELSHRNHDPTQMADFMTACVEHHDPERLACIRAAETAGAALACKPQKKRPD